MINNNKLAGAAGFEPTHDGIKNRCLTAWRRPKNSEFSLQTLRCNHTNGLLAFAHNNDLIGYTIIYPHQKVNYFVVESLPETIISFIDALFKKAESISTFVKFALSNTAPSNLALRNIAELKFAPVS